MWHTPTGNRIIAGAEAELIRASVGVIVGDLVRAARGQDDCWFDAGIDIFDALPVSQKLAALEQVARHLFTFTREPLPLTAVNESVIGAIFENVRQQVELEVMQQDPYREDWYYGECEEESWRATDGEPWAGQELYGEEFATFEDTGGVPECGWRERVLAAAAELRELGAFGELSHGIWPEACCTDIYRWDLLIESLADCILWDRDYEMAEAFLDDDPEQAAAKKMMLGIDEDYFTGLAPDPRDEQLGDVVASITRLTRAKPR
jgi:hypothetical protein